MLRRLLLRPHCIPEDKRSFRLEVGSLHPREAATLAFKEAVEKSGFGSYLHHNHARVVVRHAGQEHRYVVSAELKTTYHAREVDRDQLTVLDQQRAAP